MKFFWIAVSMTAEGPRKGESPTRIMRNGLRTQPAPLVRGSSRRIMSMRFRPAHISVINRRACFPAVIGTADRKFFLPLSISSVCRERSLSRIHLVALRASLTDSVLYKICSAYQSERKNLLASPFRGLTWSLHINSQTLLRCDRPPESRPALWSTPALNRVVPAKP